MLSDSVKLSDLNRPIPVSAIAGVGATIGTYVALRRSDLKIAEQWDLQDNRYFVPGVSIAVGTIFASTAGLISYLLSKKN
tara:strand:- start:2871 stop:3110 length:240 start_codon:yes stop_codon:yes gene_type:complete